LAGVEVVGKASIWGRGREGDPKGREGREGSWLGWVGFEASEILNLDLAMKNISRGSEV